MQEHQPPHGGSRQKSLAVGLAHGYIPRGLAGDMADGEIKCARFLSTGGMEREGVFSQTPSSETQGFPRYAQLGIK